MSAPLSPEISLQPSVRSSPGWGWKLLAVVMALLILIGDVPKLANLGAHQPIQILLLPINFIALAGLFQYSFGKWIRPGESFWRPFGLLFCVVTTAQVGYALPPIAVILYLVGGSFMGVLGMIVGAGLPLFLAILVNVALLRLGRWIGPNRRPFETHRSTMASTI